MQAICDQILMIAHGKLVAFDDPQKLEKTLLSSNEITLTTDATEDELREILSSVDHITEVTTGIVAEKWTVARIKTDHNNIYDLSRDVFLAFTKSKNVILEMSLKKGTLEDIFIELSEVEPDTQVATHDETHESEVEEA